MRKHALLLTIMLLFPAFPCFGQVVYESVGSGNWASGTSGSFSITLGGASSTRAVLVGVNFFTTGVSAISVTLGGNSMALVTGTDTGATYNCRSMVYGLATSLTGAQTVAISWTTASVGSAGAVSATGVNQGTPFNNGTKNGSNGSPATVALAVTSANGDLTFTTAGGRNPSVISSNQTQKWTQTTNFHCSGDIGPGTGTTTHTWTYTGTLYASVAGANFVQSTGAAAFGGHPLIF